MRSAPTIRLELRRSRWQRAVHAGLVGFAVLSLSLAPWPVGVRVLAVLGLLLSLLAYRRVHPAPVPPSGLEWRADGTWWLDWPGATEPLPVQLRQARVAGAVIAVDLLVPEQDPPETIALRLWPDSADAQALRRLRVRLRNSPDRHGVG